MNGPRIQMSAPMAPATLSAPPPSSASAAAAPARSPPSPLQSHLPSPLSLGLLPLPPPPGSTTRPPPSCLDPAESAPVARVRLADVMPYEGAPGAAYVRAVESLSGSLMRHNAVVIELGSEEAVVVRCALESVRMYFKARARSSSGGGGVAGWGKASRGVYIYRAGR